MVAQRPVSIAPSPPDKPHGKPQDKLDFGTVFDRAPAALAVIRLAGEELTVIAVNASLQARLGAGPAQVLGRSLTEVFPQTAPVLAAVVRKAALSGASARATVASAPDGLTRRCVALADALDDRAPAELVLLSLSLPAPRATAASVVTLDQLEALGEGLIFVVDLVRRRARYLAPELARRLGQAGETVLDLDAARGLVHPDDYAAVAACFSGLGQLTGAAVSTVTMRIARPEGGWRWLDVRCRALTADRSGKARTVLGVAVDITERRAMSRALDRAARAVLRAGEQERRRVARNLHDSTAQHLVALDLGLSNLERSTPPSETTASVMRDMREALAAAHREIRTYSYLLHPPQLQRLGLETTLRRFVEGFSRRSELAVDLQVAGGPQPLSAELELALFRVAQEAIMNVHRHAHASRAWVRLTRFPETVRLEIEDDGVGLTDTRELVRAREEGVGIAGMHARMTQLGGLLELVRLPKGLCVRAEAPVQG